MQQSPQFSSQFQDQLKELFRWRRDVRHFRPDPVPGSTFDRIVEAASFAPSVGLSQSARLVRVLSEEGRAAMVENFMTENRRAIEGYEGERKSLYASLKLSGMREAPEHLAVFCDDGTAVGAGLGQLTMPETRRYSVVAAVVNMWLMARSLGVGMGWVSVLNPVSVRTALDVPVAWSLVAYLCIGYAAEDHDTPELERRGWEARRPELLVPVIR